MGDTDELPANNSGFVPEGRSLAQLAKKFDNQLLAFLAIMAVIYSTISIAFFISNPTIVEFIGFMIATGFIWRVERAGLEIWIEQNLTENEKEENNEEIQADSSNLGS